MCIRDRIDTNVNDILFNLGINPGGPKPSILSYGETKWTQNYDWDTKKFIPSIPGSEIEHHHRKILYAAKSELLVTIFAHNKRSLESLVQGYVSVENPHPDSKYNEFVNSAIRILGENWKLQGYNAKYPPKYFPRKLGDYARTVSYTHLTLPTICSV